MSKQSSKKTAKLQAAYETWLARQDRSQHPEGRCDKGGRWWPSEAEEQACCSGIRSPSRSYPWSLMTHCRTLDHVARLHGVEPTDLRAYKAAQDRAKRATAEYYKAVAVAPDGRLLSIYDGTTEYRIGELLQQRARRDHHGGYYVYESAQQAAQAKVPERSTLADAPRAILRVKAEGAYCRYGDKLAFSKLTPLAVEATVGA